MGVKKIKKIGISLDDKTLKLCDKYADRTSKSRSDFIAKAIREYISAIEIGRQKNIIAEHLADEIVKGSEKGVTKISKGLFRYAVEVEMIIMILSELTDVPPEVMAEYRKKAVRNVRRTRGKINLDDLIARNNREFAEKKIAENPYEYKDDEAISRIFCTPFSDVIKVKLQRLLYVNLFRKLCTKRFAQFQIIIRRRFIYN